MATRRDAPDDPVRDRARAPVDAVARIVQAHAGLLTAMQAVAEQWYERRAADIRAVGRLVEAHATCRDAVDLLQLHQRCMLTTVEQLFAELFGLHRDALALVRVVQRPPSGEPADSADAP